jgi:excisionase family DNA binding protein
MLENDWNIRAGTTAPAAERVPIYRKLTLTIREAAEYSNIGINKIDAMLKAPNCPFVLFVGTKKLVKRCEFEEYIRQKIVI